MWLTNSLLKRGRDHLSMYLLVPLMFAVSMLTSSPAEAQAQSGTLSCSNQASPERAKWGDLNIVDGRVTTTRCSYTGNRYIANGAYVRRVKSAGDVVCLNSNRAAIPRDFAVTSMWYDSRCGLESSQSPNTGTIYKAYEGMWACPSQFGKYNRFSLPTGFGFFESKSSPACPGGFAEKLRRIDSGDVGINLGGGSDWWQIQNAQTFNEVYQGRAKFVILPKGTYNVINLTTGKRNNGVVVR